MKWVATFALLSILLPSAHAERFVPVCERSAAGAKFLTRIFQRPCSKIGPEDLKGLEEIEISGMWHPSFQQGDFSGLSNVRTLRFSELSFLDLGSRVFVGLDSVEQITLNDTGIEVLRANTFLHLDRLQDINITSFYLREIEPGAFNGLKSVNTITIISGKIAKISRGVFAELPELRKIELINLEELELIEDFAFVDLPKLESVSFGLFTLSPLRHTTKAAFAGVPSVDPLPKNFDVEPESWGTP